MSEAVLTRPRKVRLPWIGAVLGILVALATLVSNTFDVDVYVQTSDWEAQGASGCSDAYGAFDAFIPGMRGHGSCNRGGFVPGTTVYVVDTLAATGTGSLDWALDQGCPKVILFEVSGLIDRDGQIVPNICDNWSIVGASSQNGIAVTGAESNPLLATRGDYWTIDHLTLAAGDFDTNPAGTLGNRDSVAFGTGGSPSSYGIMLNNNLIWGADETVQCNPPTGSESQYLLWWQNIIAMPVAGSGVHIIQNSCWYTNSIRNYYAHSSGRHPLVRGDGYYHVNNFTANPGYQHIQLQPCDGSASTPTAQTRMNIYNNLAAHGQNTGGGTQFIELTGGSLCTDLQVYEFNNHVFTETYQVQDCTNHACAESFSAGDWEANEIAAAAPSGYVPEAITASQSSYIDFATQITTYAGAFPQSRAALFDTIVAQGINHVDGAGDRGGWGDPTFPQGAPLDGTTDWGGVSVITPTSGTRDPTTQCGGMPTGGAADAIQSSGLTGLHEWVIECFYDSLMPSGYREAL